MILTRTPLRISIGGGGTDLPSYYREFGGFVISAAISKYVYIGVNRSFLPGYLLKYSEMEHAADLEAIRHPLLREALTGLAVESGIEIVSVADVPAGTGLGSSGSFLVGLLHALYAFRGETVTADRLASEAAAIEMERLREPVGKQDQYSAAFGGLLCQEYRTDGSVEVTPLSISPASVIALQASLALYFVGETRRASSLLEDQRRRSEAGEREITDSLHSIRQLGLEIRRVLEAGRVEEFGPLLDEHWHKKRQRAPGITNPAIDAAYVLAMRSGAATGGKLVGAGGGGFLLFQTTDREKLRDAMAPTGMRETRFNFDFDGSVLLLGSSPYANDPKL